LSKFLSKQMFPSSHNSCRLFKPKNVIGCKADK
jgi:hypothetical protein